MAPHKPLLLLVVCDMAASGELPEKILSFSGELVFRFVTYWSVVAHRRNQKPDVLLPFFHLQSSTFWEPLDVNGFVTRERKLTVAVRFDPSFREALNSHVFRDLLRKTLIATYFTSAQERVALCEFTGTVLTSDDLDSVTEAIRSQIDKTCREARFRLAVVPAYNYTCALTGYRVVTRSAGAIVDAAHIHRFSVSKNNDRTNGIALCKNAHWLFDQGLWSIDENHLVVVAATAFEESGDAAYLLRNFHGRRLHLPSDSALWPNQSCIAWHRKNCFQQT